MVVHEGAHRRQQGLHRRIFGGTVGTRIGQPAVDLPGVNLTFAPAPELVGGTRGRAIDHIGFEVSNLEQFPSVSWRAA
jgi:hypothetical protein